MNSIGQFQLRRRCYIIPHPTIYLLPKFEANWPKNDKVIEWAPFWGWRRRKWQHGRGKYNSKDSRFFQSALFQADFFSIQLSDFFLRWVFCLTFCIYFWEIHIWKQTLTISFDEIRLTFNLPPLHWWTI